MFYDRFLELCRQKGVSPAAAAREMGFSNATTTQWSHGSIPSKASLSKISTYFDVSTDYLKTGIVTESTSENHFPDDIATIEPGTFQFERFVHLCKQQGKMQSHLYDLVGLPSKAGSNLKRTKKVKPEILEVWAAELNTSAAYLTGQTDDPAPEQKEKVPQSDVDLLMEGLNAESIRKLREYAELLLLGQEQGKE